METGILLLYILKVAALLLSFYLLNRVLLAHETLHRFNRFIWIATTVAAFLLPLAVVLPEEVVVVESLTYSPTPIIASTPLVEVDSVVDFSGWVNGLMGIYLAGVLLLLVRTATIYVHLAWLIGRSDSSLSTPYKELFAECEREARIRRRVRYIVHRKNLAPFSWFNFVVLSERDLAEQGRVILAHELAHVAQHHSMDIVLLNLVTALQWFNPAAWLTKREVQQVHEYCADDRVMSSGINSKNYQLLLIQKAAGSRLYSISNSLNHSNLKNRITMMKKEKSNSWRAAKALYILPFALGAMSLFANEGLNNHLTGISEVKFTTNQTDLQIAQSDSTNQKPLYLVDGVVVADIEHIDPNTIESVDVLRGNNATATYGEGAKYGAIAVTLKKGANATLTYSAKKGDELKVISATARKKNEATNPKPLYIVDGVEVANIESIDPATIASISVLKDESATRLYGEKGKNGVVIVTLK